MHGSCPVFRLMCPFIPRLSLLFHFYRELFSLCVFYYVQCSLCAFHFILHTLIVLYIYYGQLLGHLHAALSSQTAYVKLQFYGKLNDDDDDDDNDDDDDELWVCDRASRRRFVNARRFVNSMRRLSDVRWVSPASWKSSGRTWRRRKGHARLPRASCTRHQTVSPNSPTPTRRCRRRNANWRATSRRCMYVTSIMPVGYEPSVLPWAPAGIGKRGHFPPLWKCKLFLCISGYSKTLSRRIIYVLFSQPVVGFWGFAPTPGAPSLDPAGGLSSPYLLFVHPRAPMRVARL